MAALWQRGTRMFTAASAMLALVEALFAGPWIESRARSGR